ncbi:MAG: type II secretion system minor pseudopilin GspI [Dokdonella sp.]
MIRAFPRFRRSGFTLIEVMIALVVVALAMLALTRLAAVEIQTTDGLRERTLAGWIAANAITETKLASPYPPTGVRDARGRFGNRDWRWRIDVQATPDERVRRIDVSVFLGEAKEPSASLSGFAGADLIQ